MKDDLQFQIFLAKLFGEKVTYTDSGWTITAFNWRGKCYFTDFSPV